MKELIIFGKASVSAPIETFKNENTEIWMLGTDPRKGGDVYFELHNLKINNHQNVTYELPEKVYSYHLPINNSVSALLVFAWIKGFKKIKILGCPMDATNEYKTQKPALAFIIGYLTAKGLSIKWDQIPANKDYGKMEK